MLKKLHMVELKMVLFFWDMIFVLVYINLHARLAKNLRNQSRTIWILVDGQFLKLRKLETASKAAKDTSRLSA